MSIKLSSPAFREGQSIPIDYTGDGLDRSPPLAWTDPPAGTASLALICEDPDAPRGTWTHWVLFNLPPNVSELAEGQFAIGNAADGVRQGKNDFGKLGYGGPAPPRGKPHHYYFKLYALDTALKLPAGATRAELLSAIQGHVLDEAEYMGTYQR
jgi:Raf kinase inhibitor-like YbhB/YbcL family protein